MKIPFAPNPHTLLDLAALTPDQINFRHIAKSLSGMRRFNGSVPFTVAQHSLAVASMVEPRARPWALLHDAHEAYTGDIPGPIKAWIRDVVGQKFDTMFQRMDYVIADAAGLVHLWADPDIVKVIKHADRLCLCDEMAMWFDRSVLDQLPPMETGNVDLRPFIELRDPYSAYLSALRECGVPI